MMPRITTCRVSLILAIFSAFLIVSGAGFSPLRSFVITGGYNAAARTKQHNSYTPTLPSRCHRMTKFDEEWGETKPKRKSFLERKWPKTAAALGAIASLTESGLPTNMVVPGYVAVLLALWATKRATSDAVDSGSSFYSSNAISSYYSSNASVVTPTITDDDDEDKEIGDDDIKSDDEKSDNTNSNDDKIKDSKSSGGKPNSYLNKSQLDNYYTYGNKSDEGSISGTTKFGDYYDGNNLEGKGKPLPRNNFIKKEVDKPKLSKADAQKLVTYQSWISSQRQYDGAKEEIKDEVDSTPTEQEEPEEELVSEMPKVPPKLLIQKTKVAPPKETESTDKDNPRKPFPTRTALVAGSMAVLARSGLASSLAGPGYAAIILALWISKRTPSERSIRGGSGYYKKRIVKDVISGEPREVVSAWVSNRMDADASKATEEEATLEKQRQWEVKEAAKAKKWVASTLKNTELLWSEVEERRKLEAFERKQAEMWVENASRGGGVSRGGVSGASGSKDEPTTGEVEEDGEGQPWSGGQWAP